MAPITQMAVEAWANIPKPCEGPEIENVAWICVPGYPSPLPMFIQEEEVRAWTGAAPGQRPFISVADLVFSLAHPPQTSDELAHSIASLLGLPYHPKYTVFDPDREQVGDRASDFLPRLSATLTLYGADALLLYWVQSRKNPLVIPFNRVTAGRQVRPEIDTFHKHEGGRNTLQIGYG